MEVYDKHGKEIVGNDLSKLVFTEVERFKRINDEHLAKNIIDFCNKKLDTNTSLDMSDGDMLISLVKNHNQTTTPL